MARLREPSVQDVVDHWRRRAIEAEARIEELERWINSGQAALSASMTCVAFDVLHNDGLLGSEFERAIFDNVEQLYER